MDIIKTGILITTLLATVAASAAFKNIEIKTQTEFHYLTDKPKVVIKFENNLPVEEVGYTDSGILEYQRKFKEGIITEFKEYTPTGGVDSISKYKNGQITYEEVYFEGTMMVESKIWINSGLLEKIFAYRPDGSMSYSVEKNKNGELIRTVYGIGGVIVNKFIMPTPFPEILLDTRSTNTGDLAEYYDNGVIRSLIKVEYLDPKLREEEIVFLQDAQQLVNNPDLSELNIPENYNGVIYAEVGEQKDGSSSFSVPPAKDFIKFHKDDDSYGSENQHNNHATKANIDNKKPKRVMLEGKLIAEEFYDSSDNLTARVEYINGKRDKKVIFDEYGLIDALFTRYEDGKWKERK